MTTYDRCNVAHYRKFATPLPYDSGQYSNCRSRGDESDMIAPIEIVSLYICLYMCIFYVSILFLFDKFVFATAFVLRVHVRNTISYGILYNVCVAHSLV